jgi:hypothetical protein
MVKLHAGHAVTFSIRHHFNEMYHPLIFYRPMQLRGSKSGRKQSNVLRLLILHTSACPDRFGFVKFKTRAAAAEALEKLGGKSLPDFPGHQVSGRCATGSTSCFDPRALTPFLGLSPLTSTI